MGLLGGNPKRVFGLDIGFETLKLCESRHSNRSAQVVGLSEYLITERILEKDTIKNKAKVANIIKDAMKKAKPHTIHAKRIVTALPESFVFSKTIQMPKMNSKELRLAVPNEAAQYIPMPVSEVYIDFQVLVSHPDETQMDVLIAAAPKKLVDDYVEVAKMADLELAALETKPIAVGRAIIPDNSNEGVVILHIGTEISRISIWDKGDIRLTTTISTGKSKLLESLGTKGVLSEEISKSVIDENNKNLIALPLSAAIEEVSEAIRYHHNRSQNPSPINHIELCGSGALIIGLDKVIEEELKIRTYVSPTKYNLKDQVKPHFMTSFGLSLREI